MYKTPWDICGKFYTFGRATLTKNFSSLIVSH